MMRSPMPTVVAGLSSLTRRELVFLAVAIVAVLMAAWLFFAQLSKEAPPEESVAIKAAEDVAKSENPFKADNPLVGVEANPFSEVKKVLNPFEQQQ